MLFLDEISLFRNDVLDSLRAPLEEGVVRLARSGGVVTYPARFSLVAATNPCPCGYADDRRNQCRCSDRQLAAYDAKLSGPLLDRIDMQVALTPLTRSELLGESRGEPSTAVRERVEKARIIQLERYGSSIKTNASVSRGELDASLHLDASAKAQLGSAIDEGTLSGRGLTRLLRVARTIADLQADPVVTSDHLGRALLLRLKITREEASQ